MIYYQRNLWSVFYATPADTTVNVSDRFGTPLTDAEFDRDLANRIPTNTQKNTDWAVSIFHEWRTWRNCLMKSREDAMWPIPSLKDGPLERLGYWLSRFIVEVKRQDKTPYPPGQ